jgi:hypothetical protein
MKTLLMLIIAAALCMPLLAQTPAAAPPAAAPAQVPKPGTFYKSPTGDVLMERVSQSGFKTTGKTKSMFSYGIAKVNGLWVYRNPSATLQLSDNKPTFVVVPVPQQEVSIQDFALVKMEQKKDHRESEYCKAGAWSGAKLENKSGVKLNVTRTPEGNITVTPADDLPVGEYLLVTTPGYGAMGYDFGVISKSK